MRVLLAQVPPRSWLFVPGPRAGELFPKAARSGADAIVVDLEDAVVPSAKDTARQHVLDSAPAWRGATPWYLRVNAAPDTLLHADLRAALQTRATGILLPKVSCAADIRRVSAMIDTLEGDGASPSLSIVALVESAAGVLGAGSLAGSSRRLIALGLGGEDLRADLGITRTRGGIELLAARGLIVLAAGAACCWALDTPCTILGDPRAIRREARLAHQMGFAGKMAIHPGHVATINEMFSPTEAELINARAVVSAAEQAAARGQGVLRVGDAMIDEPVLIAARRTLARARGAPDRGSTGGLQ